MRASMALRLSASWSNSSLPPPVGTRRVRSPAMISRLVRLIASMRASSRRLIRMPPSRERPMVRTMPSTSVSRMWAETSSRSRTSWPTSRNQLPRRKTRARPKLIPPPSLEA